MMITKNKISKIRTLTAYVKVKATVIENEEI